LLDIDGDGHITQTEYNKGFAILDKDQNEDQTFQEPSRSPTSEVDR
jgi:hypothetical protein